MPVWEPLIKNHTSSKLSKSNVTKFWFFRLLFISVKKGCLSLCIQYIFHCFFHQKDENKLNAKRNTDKPNIIRQWTNLYFQVWICIKDLVYCSGYNPTLIISSLNGLVASTHTKGFSCPSLSVGKHTTVIFFQNLHGVKKECISSVWLWIGEFKLK